MLPKDSTPMIQQKSLKDKETLDGITRLSGSGIEKICVILRHSARHYSDNALMEPFMGLTDTGKTHAFNLGMNLPVKPYPLLFSSPIGRCIETACLVDKGYSKSHGRFNPHNSLVHDLSPFYIKDMGRVVTLFSKTDTRAFIRSWFNKMISQDIMEDPETTAKTIVNHLKTKLSSLEEGTMALCVSHDWNLFAIKEYALGLRHEDYGGIGYLESILLFEQNGKQYITNHQISAPLALT